MNHPKLEYLKRFVKQNDPKEEYKVLACIGSGTYGDVFKAIHRETREPVAVKIMKIDLKDDIRSICQEIHTLRECRHPNIVQFYGSYLRNNKLWICMEYCGGQSMQDIYLYTRRPLEEECIAFVSRETLQGLSFMHERGRIHRDIKGANILLTDDGRVKVADFGVAAQLNSTVGKRTTLIGTPYWMAPEVASIDSRGAGYDCKCDVWGVGITAIEYAELQPPMFDLDPRKALQILGTRNYRPPTLQDRNKWSRHFHSFVKCCLVKQERNRPDAATMLTHVFVTNPSLSTLLTQRLLNYKRQLEIRASQNHHLRTQSPHSPPPEPSAQRIIPPVPALPSLLGSDSKVSLFNLPQNGVDVKPDTANSFDRGSHPPSAITSANGNPVEIVRSQLSRDQFVSTRHVLYANDSRLFSAAQMQDSPSIIECPLSSNESSTASSEVISADSSSNPNDVTIRVDPNRVASSNGFMNRDAFSRRLSDSASNNQPPALPPKAAHFNLQESNSSDGLRSSQSEPTSSGAPTVIQSKPRRPAPPVSILRAYPSRFQASDTPAIGGNDAVDNIFCAGENSLFQGRLFQNSSEDLLREVMDAFERRRHIIDPPQSNSGDPIRQGDLRSKLSLADDRVDISSLETKLGLLIDHRKRMPAPSPPSINGASSAAPPPVRTRSKRRAPPPPTVVIEGLATEESSPSNPDSCVYHDIEPPSRIPVLYKHEAQIETEGESVDFENGRRPYSSSLVVRCEHSQEPTDDAEPMSLTPHAPPRPPPPRVDYIGASTNNEDNKRSLHSNQFDMKFGLPPTPKVLMGACFLLLFEGCPLKINATATWVNPETQSQVILFGTNDGIYFLNLVDLADGTLELLVARPCLWLSVLKDTMMSLCGQKPQLYSHNLISLMKSKGHSHPKFLQKRFQPTTKVPNTRGCHIANVVRNPYNGMKYLCGAIDKTIVVMEWYNPRSTFIEVKRVEVPDMPCPVLNFDLIICQDQPLPLVCLGVFATPDSLSYELHIVNLNDDHHGSTFYTSKLRPEDQLQVIKVVQLEYNTLLICFPTHATIVNLKGRVKVDREGWKTQLEFGTTVHSVVCLQDSVLAFHTHGLRGVGFDGQMTQDINDNKHVYRLLGCDKNVIVESRPSDDPMSNSNIYLLAGHKDLY